MAFCISCGKVSRVRSAEDFFIFEQQPEIFLFWSNLKQNLSFWARFFLLKQISFSFEFLFEAYIWSYSLSSEMLCPIISKNICCLLSTIFLKMAYLYWMPVVRSVCLLISMDSFKLSFRTSKSLNKKIITIVFLVHHRLFVIKWTTSWFLVFDIFGNFITFVT